MTVAKECDELYKSFVKIIPSLSTFFVFFISPDNLTFACNYPPGFVAEAFSPS